MQCRVVHGRPTYPDTYRIVTQVPLREGGEARMVNWCEPTTIADDGTIIPPGIGGIQSQGREIRLAVHGTGSSAPCRDPGYI